VKVYTSSVCTFLHDFIVLWSPTAAAPGVCVCQGHSVIIEQMKRTLIESGSVEESQSLDTNGMMCLHHIYTATTASVCLLPNVTDYFSAF